MPLYEALPCMTEGQECTIFRADCFPKDPAVCMDAALYVPDVSLNGINAIRRNLSEEEIDDIMREVSTAGDFLEEAYGNKACAESLFWQCDWQHPNIEDLRECTTDAEAKELWGESWTEMEARAAGEKAHGREKRREWE